ncbi:hypothetical protein [Streptosporangium sp. NBC_01756]|nr:hypothetical protein [Streptosporangium sp. NBC_01756]WSC90074.1 hypothetical protein OIE48_18405 [Streptosporangium sp. NBC_01756]
MSTPREVAIAIARSWDLTRADMDAVSDALGVPHVTDEEWEGPTDDA